MPPATRPPNWANRKSTCPAYGFVPYGPGCYIPNSIYCNVGRCLTGEAVYREAEILCDISGGVTATFPHERDFLNPETGDLLLKYTKRNPKWPRSRTRPVLALPGRRALLGAGGIHNIGAYHGGGSPIMEQIAITTQYDIESRKEAGELHRRHERR